MIKLMRSASLRLFVLIIPGALSGCANEILATHWNRPVIQDNMEQDMDDMSRQQYSMLSVTADRRLIIADLNNRGVCAEPPPEVGVAISTALAAALRAEVAKKGNVEGALTSSFAQQLQQLYWRAHTVQLFRDAAFELCVDGLNESSGKGGYQSRSAQITTLVSTLAVALGEEVKEYYKVELERAKHPPTIQQVVCRPTATIEKGDKDGKGISASIECAPKEAVNTLANADNSETSAPAEKAGEESGDKPTEQQLESNAAEAAEKTDKSNP